MKNKKIKIDDISIDIIDLLLFENTILRKKQNNQKLNDKEMIFDLFILPPSFLIRNIIKGEKNESR